MGKTKHHTIFDQIPQYGYCDIEGMTIVALRKYKHNEIFDNHQ